MPDLSDLQWVALAVVVVALMLLDWLESRQAAQHRHEEKMRRCPRCEDAARTEGDRDVPAA